MKLHLQDFYEGIQETMRLYKSGEDIFDMGNVSMFPSIDKQQKWRYAHDDGKIHLSDGQNVYSFQFPSNEEGNEFEAHRTGDVSMHDFEKLPGKKGLAQVHRADPGSIYFTLQEGTKNPTYTLRHVGGEKWRAIPKKKAKSKVAPLVEISEAQKESVKQAMVVALLKQAGFFDNMGHLGGQLLTRGGNLAEHTLLAPGRHPLLAAGLGAAGGAAYHYGKRNLYNTQEENDREDQEDPHALLKRILIPGAGLGALGATTRNMLSASPGQPGSYYDRAAFGEAPDMFPTSGPLVNPFR